MLSYGTVLGNRTPFQGHTALARLLVVSQCGVKACISEETIGKDSRSFCPTAIMACVVVRNYSSWFE